jgi:hypothetical protein
MSISQPDRWPINHHYKTQRIILTFSVRKVSIAQSTVLNQTVLDQTLVYSSLQLLVRYDAFARIMFFQTAIQKIATMNYEA